MKRYVGNFTRFGLPAALLCAVLTCHGIAVAATITDGFEATVLHPSWVVSSSNGSHDLTSTRALSGEKSLQLNTTNASATKAVDVSRSIANPAYGTASVWFYDAFADDLTGNYITFRAANSALDRDAALYTQDYDLGPTNGGNYYVHAPSGDKNTSVDCTKNWHHFQIETRPDLLKMSVDSVVVHTEPAGFPIGRVALSIHAPGFRPGRSMQFDDFQLISIPEPQCIALVLMGIVGAFIKVNRHRR